MLLSVFEGVPQFTVKREDTGSSLLELLSVHTGIFSSKGEMRRLVQGGGLQVNRQKVADPEMQISPKDFINGKYLLIQKGKKNYSLIIIEN